MTFTEAAIHVLRQAGKPLHYKEITEIAITKNLLSHVGKTPEITMSSRLTTLTKREGEKGVIEKVKPGVFAIRDGVELPDLVEEDGDENAADAELDADAADAARNNRPPGADLFDPEEDDDDLIFADLDEDKTKRKRRRRKKRGDDESDKSEERESAEAQSRNRDSRRNASSEKDRKDREARDSRRTRQADTSTAKTSARPSGDWSREKDDGELSGAGLADEMFEALTKASAAMTYQEIAASLVASGRMAGDTRALVPTVAAALRSDNARRIALGRRPRFSVREGRARLTEWGHGRDTERALREALRAGERQRDSVRREFVTQLEKLPLVGFVEILASWLNAEAVSGLRAVQPPSAQEGALNLAGNWSRGPLQTKIAIVAFRSKEVTPQAVVAARGALHHYADAGEVWMITTGRVSQAARDEANAAGAPVALLDGMALARAFERQGIGLKAYVTTTLAFDYALLEDLGATVFAAPTAARQERSSDEEEGRSGKRRRRGRRRGRDRDKDHDKAERSASDDKGSASDDKNSAQAAKADEQEADAETKAAAKDRGDGEEAAPRKRTRRSRRKKTETASAKTEDDDKGGDKADDKDEADAKPVRRRRKESVQADAAEKTEKTKEDADSKPAVTEAADAG